MRYKLSEIFNRRATRPWRLATGTLAHLAKRPIGILFPLAYWHIGILVISCASDDPLSSDSSEIMISSGIGTLTAETRGEGVITNDLSTSLPVSFVRTDRHAQGSNQIYPANYSSIDYLPAKIDKTINRIVFDEKQFYLPDGGDTKFIGWYPQATSTTATETTKVRWNAADGTVTFPNIDGSTDILVAQPMTGSRSNRFTDDAARKIKFSHALTQVKVFVKAGHSNYIPYWGQITGIEFVGKCQPCVFTLPNPRETAQSDTVATHFPTAGATDLKMRKKGETGPHGTITLTTDETEVGYAMFAPNKIENKDTAELQIRVTTTVGGVHYIDLPFEKAHLLAGQFYYLKLTFEAIEIEPTAIIDKWEAGKTQPDEITVI